jgi:hypothetical protein
MSDAGDRAILGVVDRHHRVLLFEAAPRINSTMLKFPGHANIFRAGVVSDTPVGGFSLLFKGSSMIGFLRRSELNRSSEDTCCLNRPCGL